MADRYYISYKDFFEGDPTRWSSMEIKYFYTRHKFTDKFLIENKERLNWAAVAQYVKPNEEILEQVCDVFTSSNWGEVSFYCTLSEKFIRKHANQLNWKYLAYHQQLSEKLMNKYADKLDWESVSRNYTLSEDFMRRHADKLLWWYITEKRYLDESFIREMRDYIRWDRFFKEHWDNFYPNFMREFKKEIFNDVDAINTAAEHCSEKTVDEFKHNFLKVSPYRLLSNNKITDEFVIKYKEHFDYDYILKYRWQPGYYSPICVETRGLRDAHQKQLNIQRGWI